MSQDKYVFTASSQGSCVPMQGWCGYKDTIFENKVYESVGKIHYICMYVCMYVSIKYTKLSLGG
jgi:hypothetical protein